LFDHGVVTLPFKDLARANFGHVAWNTSVICQDGDHHGGWTRHREGGSYFIYAVFFMDGPLGL
jgi:hypothetical protein